MATAALWAFAGSLLAVALLDGGTWVLGRPSDTSDKLAAAGTVAAVIVGAGAALLMAAMLAS